MSADSNSIRILAVDDLNFLPEGAILPDSGGMPGLRPAFAISILFYFRNVK
jgi:hypothetical protein